MWELSNPAAPNTTAKAAATKSTTLVLTYKRLFSDLIFIFLWVPWIPWQKALGLALH